MPNKTSNATVAPYLPDGDQHRRQMATVLNNVLRGKLNNTGTVTLTANTTTTTITDDRLSFQSVLGFMATTANAAAEQATMYVSAQNDGSAEITHANNGQTDRIFKWTELG